MYYRFLTRLTICQVLLASAVAAPLHAQGDPSLRIQRAQTEAVPKNTSSVGEGASTNAATKANAKTSPVSRNSSSVSVNNPAVKGSYSRSASGARSATIERGIYLSKHGAYSDAYNFFTKAANAEPKNPEPYNRRARVEWQLEKNSEALEDARYAIALNPDYAEAFCTRAAILNSMGKYHDAIVDASLAAELKPKLKEAYTLQASAYRNLKQYREAEEVLQKLASIQEPISAFDEWAPTIDYTQYITDLQNKVRSHWMPPQGVYPPIVVLFKLHRDGSVSDVRVNNVGVATADNAAVEATKTSAPFNQPPAGSPPDFDVFVVLDPPVEQASAQMDASPSGQQGATAAAAPATPKAGINWGSTLNQGLNTGLNLMRFIRF